MFLHHRTQGFVLRKENSGEADQLFWIYTRDFGQLQVLGKGIRKTGSKLRGGIDVFCLSEIEFIEGRARKVLTDAVLLDRHSGLRKDLVGLRLSFRLSRLFCSLVKEREPDIRLWRLLRETWSELEREKLSFRLAILFYYHFFWNLVQFLGYRPRLDHCPVCRSKVFPPDFFFSVSDGGLICLGCARKKRAPFQKISAETIETLKVILSQAWPSLKKLRAGPKAFSELRNLHRDYLNFLHLREKKQ